MYGFAFLCVSVCVMCEVARVRMTNKIPINDVTYRQQTTSYELIHSPHRFKSSISGKANLRNKYTRLNYLLDAITQHKRITRRTRIHRWLCVLYSWWVLECGHECEVCLCINETLANKRIQQEHNTQCTCDGVFGWSDLMYGWVALRYGAGWCDNNNTFCCAHKHSRLHNHNHNEARAHNRHEHCVALCFMG